MATELTVEQKRSLFHDGYIVLKGAVSDELVGAARARINAAEKGEDLTSAIELTDLVNRSTVTPILTEAIGQFDPPSHMRVGVIERSKPRGYFTPLGYQDRDLPYFGNGLHADGLFVGASPQGPVEGTPEEIYRRMIASGPRGDIGRSADVIGKNTAPLFQDPDMTLSLGSFTAFCIVSLSDQTVEGVGQTAVVPGGHRVLEAFYRWQYEQNGCVGPEGPGWPRFDYDTPNRAGHLFLPKAVQEKLIALDDRAPETTSDGQPWPRPTQIMMEPGDAAIVISQMPHTGTRNEFGTESRKNMIVRLRAKSRQPDKLLTGVSDHPDRGQHGEWLEYEEGNDPWARSKHALTHIWDEWEGMREIAAEEQPKLADIDFSHVGVV